MSILQSCDFADFQKFPAAVTKAPQMDDQIDCRSQLAADRRQGKVHPHQYHGLKAGKHVLGAVCMAGAQGSVMSRIRNLTTPITKCSSHLSPTVNQFIAGEIPIPI